MENESEALDPHERYHVVVIREGKGIVAYMTGKPLRAKDAATFLRKCGTHANPECRYAVVPK